MTKSWTINLYNIVFLNVDKRGTYEVRNEKKNKTKKQNKTEDNRTKREKKQNETNKIDRYDENGTKIFTSQCLSTQENTEDLMMINIESNYRSSYAFISENRFF